MPLRDIDRKLVDRCLQKEPGAWNDFVDRYMGLIYHVIQHVAYARSRLLSSEDVEDIGDDDVRSFITMRDLFDLSIDVSHACLDPRQAGRDAGRLGGQPTTQFRRELPGERQHGLCVVSWKRGLGLLVGRQSHSFEHHRRRRGLPCRIA